MSVSRDQFLRRVREAVAKGARAGQGSQIPARQGIGYQGAGPDPISRFCAELKAVGGHAYCVRSPEEAIATIHRLVANFGAKSVLLGEGPVIDTLQLEQFLRR